MSATPAGSSKLAETRYRVHELLRRRWSPVAFADRLVEPEKLGSLFEAVRWAPSSFNEQPWSFLLTTRDDPTEFQRMLACLVEGNQTWAQHAPVLILSIAKLNFERTGQPNRHAFHDVGLASTSLAIQATDLGLHVHMMAGIQVDKIRQEYSVPDGHDPVAAIAVGYLGDASSLPEKLQRREAAPRQRKPLDQVAFTGRWGQPASLAVSKS